MKSKVKDQKSKVLILSAFVLVLAFLIGGCAWWRRDAAENLADPWNLSAGPVDQAAPADDLGGSGEVDSIKLTNIRELPVSSEGLAATGFDGPVAWSRDGQYVAIQLSNMTAASTQVQIIKIADGQRQAVVGGYDLHWDPADPEAIIFTQHQYYGEPDYGSHEVTLRVRQNDLFAAKVFNDRTVPSQIVGDSAGQAEVAAEEIPPDQSGLVLTKKTPDGRFVFFTKETPSAQPLSVVKAGASEDRAVLVSEADAVVGAFDLSADGRRLIYQKIEGARDEFGNWGVTEDQSKFYIADINY